MRMNIKPFRALSRVSRLAVLVAGFVACATPARNAESRPLRASVMPRDAGAVDNGSRDGFHPATARPGDRQTPRTAPAVRVRTRRYMHPIRECFPRRRRAATRFRRRKRSRRRSNTWSSSAGVIPEQIVWAQALDKGRLM